MSKESDESLVSSSLPGSVGDVLVLKEIISRHEVEIKLFIRAAGSSKKPCRDSVSSVREMESVLRAELEQRIADSYKREKQSISESEDTYGAFQKDLEDRVNDVQKLVGRDKDRVAPIRKLPTELLAFVFKRYVEMGGSPWALTFVSRLWKHIAETTPRLWTNILIHRHPFSYPSPSSFEVNGNRQYSFGNMVVCRSVEELNIMISQTGSLFLNLSINLDYCREDVAQAVFYDPRITARIASLDIRGNDVSIIKDNDQSLGPFPNLICLYMSLLDERLSSMILTSVPQSASKLRKLTILNTFISTTQQYQFWSHLTSLTLGISTSPSLLNLALPHLKQLKTLKNGPFHWPDSQTPLTRLQALISLEICCHPKDFRRLDLPALENLCLSDKRREFESHPVITNGDERPISIPALKRLKTSSRDPAPWLREFNMPLLRHFEYVQSAKGEWLSDGICLPTVEEVIIRMANTEVAPISVLKSVPNAHMILLDPASTVNTNRVTNVLWSLTHTQPNMVCPKLLSLTLATRERGLAISRLATEPLIRKILNHRLKMGIKMDSLRVYWREIFPKLHVHEVDYVPQLS